jgi:hypothetical protein
MGRGWGASAHSRLPGGIRVHVGICNGAINADVVAKHILAQSTAAKVFWLFGFQTLGIVLISLPFGIVIAKVYRRVGVWFAFFITLLAWWIVSETSILIHHFLWFRIGRDLDLVCVLPAIVWILTHRKPAVAG